MGNGRSTVSGAVDHIISLENVPQHQTIFAPLDNAHPGLFLRKVEVFSIATRVFADYKLLAWRCDQIDDTPEGEARKELLWDEAHERNAAYLYEKFVKLEALWVKLGQYLSSRADVMPPAYLRQLAKCQDSLPAVPFDVIRSIVERELGGPLESIFRSVEETPLAVASIASVHKAVLVDGREVVIKVQHQSVRERLLQDLKCLEAIGDMVRYLDPDMDFTPVVLEWSKEVPKELDFDNERKNMKRVASSIAPFYRSQELAINVRLADVVDHLVTKNVLVMKLVNGFKIDNRALLDEHGLDREVLIRDITRAYAHQIFVEGFYSGDPHPGNILVDPVLKEAVLLDFGLTKEVTADIKYHFAKLIVAADEQDIHGLLEALQGVGLKLRTDVPFDIALLAKYFFREAKKATEAQEENKKRRAEWKEEAEVKKKTLYVGDRIDVITRNLIGWRSSRKGEVIEAVSPTELRVRFALGDEEVLPRECCSLQKSRSPIDSWPSAFIFFERVLGLLRGLTASLEVNQSYLEVMTPYARLALSKHALSSPRPSSSVRGVDTLKLTSLIEELIIQGDVLGCQVSVVRNGEVLADIAAGSQEPYHNTPVESDTLFCCFSVTKAVSAAAIHLLVDRGLVDLETPIAIYWPEFAAHGKGGITVADVLSHKAGLQNAGTHDVSSDPYCVTDSVGMTKKMADASLEHEAVGKTAYHYLSQGWILDGVVRSVTANNQGLQEFVAENIAQRLGMENEISIGVPSVAGGKLASLTLAKFTLPSAVGAPPPPPPPPLQRSGDAAATAETVSTKRRPPTTPSLLMNPTFFNDARIRAASLPSANGHFSARGLTTFYSALSGGDELLSRGFFVKSMLAANATKTDGDASNEQLLQGESGRFRLGLMVFPTIDDKPDVVTYGHSGLGGSLAFARCDGQSGDVLAVAITLNRLNMDAAATRRIVRHIYGELGLCVPSAFARE